MSRHLTQHPLTLYKLDLLIFGCAMLAMTFQNFLRWLLPKDDHFFDYLEQQADIACKAAAALQQLVRGASVDEVRAIVEDLEREGDTVAYQMLEALGRTFVTPIHREDLQKLSKRTDDITDLCNASASACVLFGVNKPTPPMCVLIENLVASTIELAGIMPYLRKHDYDKVRDGTKKIKQLEKDSDIVFRDAISKLFHDPTMDAKDILREKEVLDDLEKAVDRCEQVADALTAVAVKHA